MMAPITTYIHQLQSRILNRDQDSKGFINLWGLPSIVFIIITGLKACAFLIAMLLSIS